MARQIPAHELDSIQQVIANFPEGISLGKILKVLGSMKIAISLRNLRYRLEFLLKNEQILAIGKTRTRLYCPIGLKKQISDEISSSSQINQNISLTPISKEIQALVRQPIQTRSVVGYNRAFLDQYKPNETRYLSDAVCKKLLKLGETEAGHPAGTYAKQIINRLLIDLSWNSSRLEGNTYSLLETERLLQLSEIVASKDLKEAQMILNHKDAIEFLIDSSPLVGINRYTILSLHALLSNELMGNLEASGRLRSMAVGIRKSIYHPLSIPQLIEECFQQIIETANAIKNPFEQAFFLMVHLPYLQPFEDVNKRVSRLAANIPLIQKNLCPLSFVDVPQEIYVSGLLGVYELNKIDLLRDVFIWAYERSCLMYSVKRRELGDPDPFRIRYRPVISELVVHIVRNRMNKTNAIAHIRNYAKISVPVEEQIHFIEEVEKDLMSLHEGNIARHRLLPSEYQLWQEIWL